MRLIGHNNFTLSYIPAFYLPQSDNYIPVIGMMSTNEYSMRNTEKPDVMDDDAPLASLTGYRGNKESIAGYALCHVPEYTMEELMDLELRLLRNPIFNVRLAVMNIRRDKSIFYDVDSGYEFPKMTYPNAMSILQNCVATSEDGQNIFVANIISSGMTWRRA